MNEVAHIYGYKNIIGNGASIPVKFWDLTASSNSTTISEKELVKKAVPWLDKEIFRWIRNGTILTNHDIYSHERV